MADTFSKEVRSKIMASIRSSNTTPETAVRKILKELGIKFSRHAKSIPGTPDFVLREEKIAIFVHGCFWHFHGCSISHMPKSRKPFWTKKFDRNMARDLRVYRQLKKLGWRILIIWECSLKTRSKITDDEIKTKTLKFLSAKSTKSHIRGRGRTKK